MDESTDLPLIRKLILELLAEVGREDTVFSNSTSLFRSGILDSVSAIKLANRLETDFAVRFDIVVFSIAKIDSIDAILKLTATTAALRALQKSS